VAPMEVADWEVLGAYGIEQGIAQQQVLGW